MSNSLIRATKQALADALLANPYFASIPVMVRVPKDIQSQIDEATYPLAGGMVVIIGAGTLKNSNPDAPGPVFNDGSFMVELLQNPTLTPGAATYDVDEAGETAMRLCHLLNDGVNVFVVTDWAEVEDAVFSRRFFKVDVLVPLQAITLPPLAPVVVSPTTPGAQTVTLSCATPGAAIFYTLGATGSVPYPAPLNATLYTSPVAVLAGQQLRARAWLAGYAAAHPPDVSTSY